MKAQAVSKAGIKIERLMKENREDKESGKQANFYFRGLTPFLTFLTFPQSSGRSRQEEYLGDSNPW